MGMVFAVAYDPSSLPSPPKNFDTCGDVSPGRKQKLNVRNSDLGVPLEVIFGSVIIVMVVLGAAVWFGKHRNQRISQLSNENVYLLSADKEKMPV